MGQGKYGGNYGRAARKNNTNISRVVTNISRVTLKELLAVFDLKRKWPVSPGGH